MRDFLIKRNGPYKSFHLISDENGSEEKTKEEIERIVNFDQINGFAVNFGLIRTSISLGFKMIETSIEDPFFKANKTVQRMGKDELLGKTKELFGKFLEKANDGDKMFVSYN